MNCGGHNVAVIRIRKRYRVNQALIADNETIEN